MNFKPFSSQNENENISYWIAPQDFAHMRQREEEMRDTNESTNSRVLYFSIFSMLCLLGLATWQVLYLRKYFKSKKLIEWASPPIALVVRGLFSTDNVIHSKAVWATDWRGGPHKKNYGWRRGLVFDVVGDGVMDAVCVWIPVWILLLKLRPTRLNEKRT